MDKDQLTEEERALLKQYQLLSASMPSMTNRLAIEVVPPIILVGIWFITGSVTYLLALITLMVTYNVQRIVRQRKYIIKLNSISKKALGDVQDERKA